MGNELHTAAQQVFSLPELLEPILNHVSWSDLFVFQRVNSTFTSTISSSRPLRERQELHNIVRSADETPAPCAVKSIPWKPRPGLSSIIPELLYSNPSSFNTREFEMSRINAIITLRMHYYVRSPPYSYTGHAEALGVPRLWKRGDSRTTLIDPVFQPDGSWRRLRISASSPSRISIMNLRVCIKIPAESLGADAQGAAPRPMPAAPPGRRGAVVTYWHYTDLRTGQATFGDLADILHDMTGKPVEEHVKIWKNLNGRERIGLGPERLVPMTSTNERLKEGGGIVIETQRRKN